MSIHWRKLNSEAKIAAIKFVWRRGMSASQIAENFEGVSRSAIVGVYHRYPDRLLDTPLEGKRCAPINPRPKGDKRIVLHKPSKPLRRVRTYVEEQQLVGKPLKMLEERQCKWPVNDAARGETHLFCGLATAHGPYCTHHTFRAAPIREGRYAV